MRQLQGAGVALVTPFSEDGTVDVVGLKKIVRHNIDGGIDYLVVLGTTGESATLSKIEKQLVMDTVVAENEGILPLVLGVGGNNTYAVVEELKSLDLSDFCAVLSVSPYYNKPTQEGIFQHFKMISEASPLPIILYNVPGRTGSNMLPETVVRLAKSFDNIIGIKEASGEINQILELIRTKPKGFSVLSGDDMTAVATIIAGGQGVISVIGQGIPEEFTKMIHLAIAGDEKGAFKIHYALQEGMHLIFEEGNPAGIKVILECLGLATSNVRLPLMAASSALKHRIVSFLHHLLKVPA